VTRYAGLEKILMLGPLGVEAADEASLPRLYLASRPATPKNLVALVPASRRITRQWPAASFSRLGKLLRERYGCELVVFWGPGERALAQEVAAGIGAGAAVSPETRSLKDLAKLMVGCRLVLTIHGSSDPASWNPPHPRHRTVRRDELPCIGCRSNACPFKLECLEGLSPERVLEAAAPLLEEARSPA
jgi:ADP-heptose:LPS heptosyltransferase